MATEKKENKTKEEKLTNNTAIVDLKERIQRYEILLIKSQGALEVLEQIEESS
jgi:hypothetical protein